MNETPTSGTCKWCGQSIAWDAVQDDYVTADLDIHCGEGTHAKAGA